jgi:hypothetical protein
MACTGENPYDSTESPEKRQLIYWSSEDNDVTPDEDYNDTTTLVDSPLSPLKQRPLFDWSAGESDHTPIKNPIEVGLVEEDSVSISDESSPDDSEKTDADSDYSSDLLGRSHGTSVEGYVVPNAMSVIHRASNPTQASNLQHLCDSDWSVTTFGETTSEYVNLIDLKDSTTYNVRLGRVPKAKLHLSYGACLTPMIRTSCICQRKCHRLILDPLEVRKYRKDVFVDCESEEAVNEYLLTKIKLMGGFAVRTNNSSVCTRVCRKYFGKLHGLDMNRCQTAKNRAQKGKSRAGVATKVRKVPDAKKYDLCFAFWSLFFEENCQRPNAETRLFPVDKSYGLIFTEYFDPWFARLVAKGRHKVTDRPGMSLFSKARKAEAFKDVKNRRSHTHARCVECATFTLGRF